MDTVTKHTRASKKGTAIQCPKCENIIIVYHFAWSMIKCSNCRDDIPKTQFFIVNKTPVIFRKFKEGQVIALFPEESYRCNYETDSYMHIGQHGGADYHEVIKATKPAKLEEYKDLYQELEIIGYNLDVKQKAKIIYK